MLPASIHRTPLLALALSLLIFWAPLPAGSVRPADQLVFRLAACALLVLMVSGHARRWTARRALPVAALAAVGLLGLMQSCRWPAPVASLVSPEHVRLYREAALLPSGSAPPAPEAGLVDSPREAVSPAIRLSFDGEASRSAALSWLAAAALLATTLVAAARARHRRWLLAALVSAALVQIGLGLYALHGSFEGGLSAALLRPEGRLRGTFANPNHVSLLLEIVMAAVAAWGWVEMSRLRRRSPTRRARALVPPMVWLVLLGGVVLTGSRAGLVAALAGAAVQLLALPLTGRGRKLPLAVGLAAVIGLSALVGLGSSLDIRRYETVSLFESNLRSRLLLTAPALELWRRFPVTGTGLGTFEDAFPTVATPELEPVWWNRAHNDPLELLVTAGGLGLALGLVALAALLVPIWRGMRSGERLEDRAAGLAAVGALAAAGVHELFDFGLVIPANALALLLLLGGAAAVGWTDPEAASSAGAPARE